MIYRVDTYAYPDPLWPDNDYMANYAYNYLSQYIEGLTHTTNSTDIDFWGLFTLTIPNSAYSTGMSITLSGGSPISFGEGTRTAHNRPMRYTLVYDEDKFFYFSMRDRDYGGLFTLVWFVDDNGKGYVGGTNDSGNWTTGNLYGTGTVIYDMEDPTRSYHFAQMFNFTAPPGKIAIAQAQPLYKEGDISSLYTYLYTCSTVPYRSSISIMGDNFLAIDTNTLIRIPEE